MSINFPTSLDTTTELPNTRSDSTPSTSNHPEDHNDLANAVIAIEAKLGADASAVATSIDYLVKTAADPGHSHTAASISGVIETGDAAGGDLSGTYPNPTVTDDGHNHTGATLSSIPETDITDGTLLARVADAETITGAWTFNAGKLLDKGEIVFDVKAYGATGDGTTDDTTAVQAAITAANAASGGIVFFPKGTYVCSRLTVYSYIHLLGVGQEASVIKLKASANTALIQSNGWITTDSDVGVIHNLVIQNLSFNGNKANQTGELTVSNATNATPIVITTSANHGLTTGDRVVIAGVTGNTAANGIFIVTVTAATTFSLQTVTGANVAGSGAYVNGGKVDRWGLINIHGYRCSFLNIDIYSAAAAGIHTNYSTTAAVPGPNGISMENYVANLSAHDNGGDGIFWNGSHDSTIISAISYNNAGCGFYIGPRGNAGKFVSCHSYGNSQLYAWTVYGQATHLTDCEGEGATTRQLYVAASDCVIQGGHYFAAGGGTTGVEVANSSSGHIFNTKLSNFTTASILLTTDADASIFDLNVYATAGALLSGSLSVNSRLRAVVNGGQTGQLMNGPRFLPGVWVQENVAAAQGAGTYLNLLGGENGSATPRWNQPMIKSGSITGVMVRSSGARSAGTLTVTVHKNDVATSLTAVLDGTNTVFKASYSSPGAITYNIGDNIGCFIQTDASWAPTTADIEVLVEVSD